MNAATKITEMQCSFTFALVTHSVVHGPIKSPVMAALLTTIGFCLHGCTRTDSSDKILLWIWTNNGQVRSIPQSVPLRTSKTNQREPADALHM